MARRRDDESVAVAEPTRTPQEIAADAIQQAEKLRRGKYETAIERWRSIVQSIDAGQEPDGSTLAAIGELADTLRLPPDAVASAVRVLQHDRKLEQLVADTEKRYEAAIVRSPVLAQEIEDARLTLQILEREELSLRSVPIALSDLVSQSADHKRQNPLLFGDLADAAASVVASISATSRGGFA